MSAPEFLLNALVFGGVALGLAQLLVTAWCTGWLALVADLLRGTWIGDCV